jgi:DNA-binding NarL/FixJ family response regulator
VIRDLAPPKGLEVTTFELGGDEYATFSFPVPALRVPDGLSYAEQAVVRAVLEGKSNAEIAKGRGTSPNTVANQLRSIYSKLRVTCRIELVKRCLADRE